jgi:hypothetical protein
MGDFKYLSICRISKTNEVILTGGCSIHNFKASKKAFKLSTDDNPILC